MATSALRAKYNRPDGTRVIRFETPLPLVEEEAAKLLAIHYAREPVRRSIHAQIDGLIQAARSGLGRDLASRSVPAKAIKAYRDVLCQQQVFPHPQRRRDMLLALRTAQEADKGTDRAGGGNAVRVSKSQPRVWAKHTHPKDHPTHPGQPFIRVEITYYASLDETALVLAASLGPRAEGRALLEVTVRNTLAESGRSGLIDRVVNASLAGSLPDLTAELEVDPEVVADYRKALLDNHVW
jgi:hypothetical protein